MSILFYFHITQLSGSAQAWATHLGDSWDGYSNPHQPTDEWLPGTRAENIAMWRGPADVGQQAVTQWENSQGHRDTVSMLERKL